MGAVEQRLLAYRAQSSIVRRWAVVAVGVALIIGADLLGFRPISWQTYVGVLSAAVAVNLAAAYLARSGGESQWWIRLLGVADAALGAIPVIILGPGAFAVWILVIVMPYSWEEERAWGDTYAVAAMLAYVGAVGLYGIWFARPPFGFDNLPVSSLLETAALGLAVIAARRIPWRLLQRIRSTRELMDQARDGALGVRAPGKVPDQLGLMESSFNQMLEQMAKAITVVQREAEEVALLAEVLSQSTQGVLASSEVVAETTEQLARAMAMQRAHAEAGHVSSTEAAAEADGLLERARHMAIGARGLVESAHLGRERVLRAGETLLAIGEEVRSTASSVNVLSGMSERVGKFAHTIARIARQTHVLALNAAIEAAHSDDAQEGFSAVAEEVRTLAAESAESAREVAELIDEVQSRIETVARAMGAGQEQVQDVGQVAGEARQALDDLYRGASRVMELVETTAETSKSQAERMETLSAKMSQIAELSARSSGQADGAASAMTSQKSTIQDLNSISAQLADLADRVRRSVARFRAAATSPAGSGTDSDDDESSAT
jgi:methyl-accepting chemotaxis protein